MCLISPSEEFTFIEIGGKEVSATTKVLATVGGVWIEGICAEVEGLSAWIK
jgi:hypothetical protein